MAELLSRYNWLLCNSIANFGGFTDQQICYTTQWEVAVPELDTSVFIIPGKLVKNREERLVVLNKSALAVIEQQRGIHPEFVFTYRGEPLTRMNNSAWKRVRKKVGLPQARIHDLKHTFGQRLRSAGVSFEDRQDLLGHKSGRITTHYCAAQLESLVLAANKACEKHCQGPNLTVLRNRKFSPLNKVVNS